MSWIFLKNKWSPVLTVGKILLSICSLLSDPNPDDPLNVDVAELFIQDRARHDEAARAYYTQICIFLII